MHKFNQSNKITSFLSEIDENHYPEYFTIQEIEIYGKKKKKGSLAARQLLKRMLIENFDNSINFTDIEILNNDLGKPILFIKNYKSSQLENIHFSLSHSKKEVAVLLVLPIVI